MPHGSEPGSGNSNPSEASVCVSTIAANVALAYVACIKHVLLTHPLGKFLHIPSLLAEAFSYAHDMIMHLQTTTSCKVPDWNTQPL
jgi:hypothetical protein